MLCSAVRWQAESSLRESQSTTHVGSLSCSYQDNMRSFTAKRTRERGESALSLSFQEHSTA